jgi:nucleoside-diphosphate-sugar epimerase
VELRGARIAVTGATGFLGRYIVRALRARDARVVGVVRNPARVPDLARDGVELRRADLAEPDALAAGFAGTDAVVANAALLSLRRVRWEDYREANVRGTANVLAAAHAAGVRRIVQISSVAVYRGHAGSVHEDAPQLTEESAGRFTRAYSLSKALAEQLAWRRAAELGLALTTLRPCAIYGAFDPNFTAVFRRLVGVPVSVMPAWMRLPLVYAGDVAVAVALALANDASIGRAYNVTGDDATLWDFYAAWRAAGGPTPLVTVPIVVPLAWRYDHGRAARELGWRNRPFADALRETFALEAAAGAGGRS